jgi:hypothetical protein
MDQDTPTVQVKTRVTPTEAARLDALAVATRRSRSQLLRLGVDRVLSEPLVLPTVTTGPGHRGAARALP